MFMKYVMLCVHCVICCMVYIRVGVAAVICTRTLIDHTRCSSTFVNLLSLSRSHSSFPCTLLSLSSLSLTLTLLFPSLQVWPIDLPDHSWQGEQSSLHSQRHHSSSLSSQYPHLSSSACHSAVRPPQGVQSHVAHLYRSHQSPHPRCTGSLYTLPRVRNPGLHHKRSFER